MGSSFGFGDEEARAPQQYNAVEKLVNPSSGWNSQSNSATVGNKGKIDPYKQKQNQLGSSVFEQTDHSQYQPMSKHEINTNDFQAQKVKKDGARPKTDINHFDRKDNKPHVYTDAKQSMLRGAFDEDREYVRPQP